MGNRLNFLILLALQLGCSTQIPPLPVDVVVRPVGDADQCAATCTHWRSLGCEEGEPTPERSIPCEDVCRNTEEFEPQPHACFQASATCDESRECEK